jgi:hypothetical protein
VGQFTIQCCYQLNIYIIEKDKRVTINPVWNSLSLLIVANV